MAWYNNGEFHGYWRRSAYRRLDVEDGARRKVRRSKIDLGGGKRRRFWRVRVSPKLRIFRVIAPARRLISRIRDAYVRMMLGFAGSTSFVSNGCDSFAGFHARPIKEYDERMIIEIYKSLTSQGQIISTTGIGAVPSCEIAVRR